MTTPVNNDIITALIEWEFACEQLAEAKSIEIGLRNKLIEYACGTTELVEGTNKFPLPNVGEYRNTNLVVNQPYYYKVAADTILDSLKKLPEDMQRNGALISWKPELCRSAYRKLRPVHTKILAPSLTITPGARSVKVELRK